MLETYNKWNPIDELEAEMWIEALHDDSEGLKIILKGSSANSIVFCITFSQFYMYRNADESYRLKLWNKAHFEDWKWSLCYTKSSKLIDWVYEEADTVYNKENMIHYMIKTGSDVVEIVTNGTLPTITRLGEWG